MILKKLFAIVLAISLLSPSFAFAGRGLYISTADDCADVPTPVTDETFCIPTTGANKGKLLRYGGATFDVTGLSLTTDVTGVLPVANGGTGIASGTSGGIPAFTGSTTIASSGALTANLPVIGGGAGVAPSSGTRSGNTTEFATSTGSKTDGFCAEWDANGNVVESTGACGIAGSGYGTIEDEDSALTARDTLNFEGAGVTCADDTDQTTCTIPGGGGGGGLELVEAKTFTSPAQTYSFTGLDGDTDGFYKLVCHVVNGSTGTSFYSIEPNGVATNQTAERDYTDNETNARANLAYWEVSFALASGITYFVVEIAARKVADSVAKTRHYMVQFTTLGTTVTTGHYGGRWNETSTNMTSLDLQGDQTDSFSDGSQCYLYKYAQS